MAVRIYCNDVAKYFFNKTGIVWLLTNNLNTTVKVEFDGVGSGSDTWFGEYYDYITIKKQNNSITYRTSSYSISCVPKDFSYSDYNSGAQDNVCVTIGAENFSFTFPKFELGDVYLNGTNIGTFTKYFGGAEANIYICPSSDYFKPTITQFSDISIQQGDWNGFTVAGTTVLAVDTVRFGNANSDDANNYYKVDVSIYGKQSDTDYTLTRIDNNTIKITNVISTPAEENSYTLSIWVKVTNRYGGSVSEYKRITINPYHLPRLFLNRTGEVSYVSRCQQDGTPDGLGDHGHLHLVWDVSKINTTGSGVINTLQSCTVVLNGGTTLEPSGGSIDAGYLDYIFPLAVETQGNLTVTLTDTRKSNTITGLSVPKGSMPLSLYDAGGGTGVAFGRMATQEGMWCYMPLYIQSCTSGSSKMFRLKIDDNGNITAESV